MCALDIKRTRDLLKDFEFQRLFTEELGWSVPTLERASEFDADGVRLRRRQIAELSGVVVFEIMSNDGMPNAKARSAAHREITKSYHENLLIFVDHERTQSIWYWVKRENGKPYAREHIYMKGQPGDLFISKISSMVFDISRFEQGDIPIVEVAESMQRALDMERVTKRFYGEFADERLAFAEHIHGIDDPADRKWYASILLNRLMFIYFLQKKFLLDNGDDWYLQHKLKECSDEFGDDAYYERFLKLLFFKGFAVPEGKRDDETNRVLGCIKYLNGGLFIPHKLEDDNPSISIPDVAFRNLYKLFESYSWNLDDTPGGKDDEINPDVLGYIFEKYINQKAFGAYYTRPEITEYLCEHTIHQVILDKMNPKGQMPGLPTPKSYDSLPELLLDLDSDKCKKLLYEVLPDLSILDPACGSGAFLVAAMKTLINIYSAVTGKIDYLSDSFLRAKLAEIRQKHKSINYHIKREIITKNLFGVDIMEEACEIAKLRLFLALVSSAHSVDELEPLPNIDFNILPGNSLIGLLRVDDEEFNKHNAQGSLFRKSYSEVVREKNRLIDLYRDSREYQEQLHSLRDKIEETKQEAIETLDDILLDEFTRLGIKYEQSTWDAKKGAEGKPVKRAVTIDDIKKLQPFHWGYEFDKVLNGRGGFDVIITNPPWEILKPQAKEFFADYSKLVTKNKMTIKEFEEHQEEVLRDEEIRAAWLEYLSQYPHQSAFFRNAKQYENQISVVNGKKAGTDINLYKLFTEQCYNLLRDGGQCGIVIPSGIYTDLGTKQLRELLFSKTQITGLFGFENRKTIFEGVDSRFKFVVLTYGKGSLTERFPAAFMRQEVAELAVFPKRGGLPVAVTLVQRLSPDTLSIMEFDSDTDVEIAEKLLRYPLLGEEHIGSWSVSLTREFDMTNDSGLFRTSPGPGTLPLYEGKMVHQFDCRFAEPRYWVDEREGRKSLLGRTEDDGRMLDYQTYRLGFRDIAASTNERTLISAIIPPTFHGNKLPTVKVFQGGLRVLRDAEQLFLAALWNSFVMDWMIRMKVTTTLNFFYLYQLPIPRLTEKDAAFAPIVERAVRLTCTTPEFDDLAAEVGLGSHRNGATNPVERARLRAELDGLVAHLYGLTEEEFAHILSTFPLVPAEVKEAAMQAYRNLERSSL